MFTSAWSNTESSILWLWSGDSNVDNDHARWVEEIGQAIAQFGDRPLSIIMVVDPKNPPPSAFWRSRIAEAVKNGSPSTTFVLVTSSALVRGALTAIAWLWQPRFTVCHEASYEEAVELIVKTRGGDKAVFDALLAEAQKRTSARKAIVSDFNERRA